ncbi:hypothetical protein LQ318_02475 [Aliifodinibius salicampi]|uniref:Uncharacterized protein n=1 Tax=Fodinibius salicampi TaxID=1920655 RepID=A0ABT3PV89_9BACT|nr:hypothetical protein [Fodinibius salicampi]MCW9711758.1 hypothetical protein [Fodinibius salicampi]
MNLRWTEVFRLEGELNYKVDNKEGKEIVKKKNKAASGIPGMPPLGIMIRDIG